MARFAIATAHRRERQIRWRSFVRSALRPSGRIAEGRRTALPFPRPASAPRGCAWPSRFPGTRSEDGQSFRGAQSIAHQGQPPFSTRFVGNAANRKRCACRRVVLARFGGAPERTRFPRQAISGAQVFLCLLYTSDAADEE